jgi:tetratricopeptide (TPR) repeat protein
MLLSSYGWIMTRVVLPIVVGVSFCFSLHSFAQDSKPQNYPDLVAAEELSQSGKLSEAIQKYQQILKANPKLVAARAGLVQAYLRDQQLDPALDLAKSSLILQPNSPSLLAAMGSVQYRLGEIPESQTSYLDAQKLDSNLPQPYLGLARLYRSALFYRRAYDEIRRAREIAPQDPEVQRAWLEMLPRRERLKALESYLGGPHPDNAEENAALHSWLEYLKATNAQPVHACRLANNVEKTATQMQTFLRDTRRISGYGLQVRINDRNQRLLLDTGASGILINRRAAEKAGLAKISAVQFGGIGDKGHREAYLAVAESIRIGDLSFKDCVVTVSEKSLGMDEDGVIGADVFSSYLVDIDIPGDTLRLSPLPRRPDEMDAKLSLATEESSESVPDEQGEAVKDNKETAPSSGAKNPSSFSLPRDRYVAPEMAQWAKVYRIGHTLLIPTRVNDSKSMLFVLDTGAFGNTISTRAAREVTKVRSDQNIKVRGFSGEVDKVYSADKATLQFGNIRQPNEDMVTFDLSGISRNLGVEVSGFLGFTTFRLLEMKIDYRDGLVQFVYDPDKLPAALRPH